MPFKWNLVRFSRRPRRFTPTHTPQTQIPSTPTYTPTFPPLLRPPPLSLDLDRDRDRDRDRLRPPLLPPPPSPPFASAGGEGRKSSIAGIQQKETVSASSCGATVGACGGRAAASLSRAVMPCLLIRVLVCETYE